MFFRLLFGLVFLLPTSLLVWANEVTLTVKTQQTIREVQPGAVGWGAMWKKEILYPAPPKNFRSDAEHRAYIRKLGQRGRILAKKADLRNISWPWGVSFSTWGVNWENSAKPWTKRPLDCARILLINKSSGWCEKTIVGIGDLITLAEMWDLEAITVSVPLAVLDGGRVRWGPHFVSHAFDDRTIEKISDHAFRMVRFMKTQRSWGRLQRVYLSAGCEWRHYGQPSAVKTYAKLVRRIREKVKDNKIIIVASASDSADIERRKANNWNKPLYESLKDIKGVALDLHRYRGMVGIEKARDGSVAPTLSNVLTLAKTGTTQKGFFTVNPRQWGERGGKPMPSVLLENAIHGYISDHTKHSSKPWPWPAVIAHADLVREALASPALTFLGWTWFPEDLPPEWPHGAILKNGTLSQHAKAQAFLTRFHRGILLKSTVSNNNAVRANAVQNRGGNISLYGGNFSLESQQLNVQLSGAGKYSYDFVEYMNDKTEIRRIPWSKGAKISIPPMTLWRTTLRKLP